MLHRLLQEVNVLRIQLDSVPILPQIRDSLIELPLLGAFLIEVSATLLNKSFKLLALLFEDDLGFRGETWPRPRQGPEVYDDATRETPVLLMESLDVGLLLLKKKLDSGELLGVLGAVFGSVLVDFWEKDGKDLDCVPVHHVRLQSFLGEVEMCWLMRTLVLEEC